MQAGNLFDPLTSEHENAHGSCIRWMDGCVRTFKPTVKPNELVFVEPARANVLRLCRNSRGGIIDEPKTTLRSASVVVLGLQPPAISGADVAAHVVGHRLLAALVDRHHEHDCVPLWETKTWRSVYFSHSVQSFCRGTLPLLSWHTVHCTRLVTFDNGSVP